MKIKCMCASSPPREPTNFRAEYNVRTDRPMNMIATAGCYSLGLSIDATTEELTLRVVGYEAGAGQVTWLYDCPTECSSCVEVGGWEGG